MTAKSKYNIISLIMNAILGVLCFFGSFFTIITVSIDLSASGGAVYKLIITIILSVAACIFVPLLFNRALFSFFKKSLSSDKRFLRRGYIFFAAFFVISFAALMIYTFYRMSNPTPAE